MKKETLKSTFKILGCASIIAIQLYSFDYYLTHVKRYTRVNPFVKDKTYIPRSQEYFDSINYVREKNLERILNNSR